MNFKERLGAKIKHLRKQQKYSQEYFSELVGMNPRQIVRIENGENMPTIDNLEKMAEVLNVSTEELFLNESFLDDKIIREKFPNIINGLSGEKLRTLYLIAINL